MSLPKTVNFGGGWKVRVVQLGEVDANAMVGKGCNAAFVIEDDDPSEAAFMGTIYLRKSLKAKQKRVLLLHELVHAVNDAYHLESCPVE